MAVQCEYIFLKSMSDLKHSLELELPIATKVAYSMWFDTLFSAKAREPDMMQFLVDGLSIMQDVNQNSSSSSQSQNPRLLYLSFLRGSLLQVLHVHRSALAQW